MLCVMDNFGATIRSCSNFFMRFNIVAWFQKEKQQYSKLIITFSPIKTDKEFTEFLLNIYENLGISKPWKGDFALHMSNKNGTLVFK